MLEILSIIGISLGASPLLSLGGVSFSHHLPSPLRFWQSEPLTESQGWCYTMINYAGQSHIVLTYSGKVVECDTFGVHFGIHSTAVWLFCLASVRIIL